MTVETKPAVRSHRRLSASPDSAFGRFARGARSVAEERGRGTQSYRPEEAWEPDANLYERDDAYVVCLDLSGVDKRRIDVTVQNQRLTIRGDRPVPRQLERARMRVHLMEIDYGTFCREVELPADVDRSAITASHENGLLWITLPKA